MDSKPNPHKVKQAMKTALDSDNYRNSVRKLIDTEFENALSMEIKKAATELLEEQKKAIAQIFEECKSAIWQVAEEEKQAVWKNSESIRRAILSTGLQ